MAIDDITSTQAEEPIMGTGVEDIPVQALTRIITAHNPEAPAMTTKMRQSLTQPAPALLGGASVPPSTSKSVSIVIVETGLGSTPSVWTPDIYILEELSMKY